MILVAGVSLFVALFLREYRIPALLHINNNPAVGVCLVEGLVQCADETLLYIA